MTNKQGLWLACSLATTVALGAFGAWLELRSQEPAEAAGSRPAGSRDEVLAAAEKKGDAQIHPGEQPGTASREATETRRPHPVTPVHVAMAERRELLGALTGALADQRYDQARALLDEAEARGAAEPESSTFQRSVRGYQLILECLVTRGAFTNGSSELPDELMQNARTYLDQERLPPRREVRRVCLEGRAFARRG